MGAFNVKGIFIGAVAGLGTLGALTFWASTCGPLGGYILVAQGTGVLAALGIPMGSAGAAGVISLVSAIGGPVTLALGMAVIAGMAFLKLFGDSWQRSLAKKLLNKLEEKQARSKWLGASETFWTQTRMGIVSGYEALDKQWQRKLEQHREMLKNPG